MSLGALIFALAMLVDNAIVVVEGTLVRVQRGKDAAEASRAVVKQTARPLLGGTIVGILVFSPIGFSPDNTGEYAGNLFWTIGVALLFSWLVAIWLTPHFCTVLLKRGNADAQQTENAILRGYRDLLALAIRAHWLTIAVVVALFASAVAQFSAVPSGFFPPSTRDQFVIDYVLPQGADITRTQADLREIADYARGREGVTGTNTVIGGGHLRFMVIYESETSNSACGQILVDAEDYTVIDGLRIKLQAFFDDAYPESNTKVWKIVLGPGGGSKVEARFFGSDQRCCVRWTFSARLSSSAIPSVRTMQGTSAVLFIRFCLTRSSSARNRRPPAGIVYMPVSAPTSSSTGRTVMELSSVRRTRPFAGRMAFGAHIGLLDRCAGAPHPRPVPRSTRRP